jgi:hypothetical protein
MATAISNGSAYLAISPVGPTIAFGAKYGTRASSRLYWTDPRSVTATYGGIDPDGAAVHSLQWALFKVGYNGCCASAVGGCNSGLQ